MRWQAGNLDPGPKYCASCKHSRADGEPCDGCPAPQLLPENDAAVRLYLACATQWRYAGLAGQRTGLDYAGVRVLMTQYGFDDGADLFGRLQVLEMATLKTDQCNACMERRDSRAACLECVFRGDAHGA